MQPDAFAPGWPTDSELRDAAAVAVRPEDDVADVVVGVADDVVDRGLVVVERRARAADLAVAGGRVLLRGLEVEEVVVGDELHADGQVVVVELVDAVHQHGLRRLDREVGRAEVDGVRGVVGEREAVDPADHGRAGRAGCRRALDDLAELVGLARRGERRAAPGQGVAVVRDVGDVGPLEVRIDVPEPLVRAHGRVEAERPEIEAPRVARVVQALPRVGLDLGEAAGERGRQHGRLLDPEALQGAVRGRDGQDRRAGAGRGREHAAQLRLVEVERLEAPRPRLHAQTRAGRRARQGVPAARRARRRQRRRGGGGRQQQQGEDGQRDAAEHPAIMRRGGAG